MVQLFKPDGSIFSSPILYSEAGVFQDSVYKFYYYPMGNNTNIPLSVDLHHESDQQRDMLGYALFGEEGIGRLRHEKLQPGEFDPRD